jgi:YHS domain-containing protein
MDMTQTKIADTLTHNGGLYAFCNSGCKEEFSANPEKYLK